MSSGHREHVVIDDAAIDRLFGGAGPVAEYIKQVTVDVFERARQNAPVGQPSKSPAGHPAGWLRDQIHWKWSGDLSTRVITNAVNSSAAPVPGNPYARQIEKPNERPYKPPPFARNDEPYLVPALEQVVAEIKDRGRR